MCFCLSESWSINLSQEYFHSHLKSSEDWKGLEFVMEDYHDKEAVNSTTQQLYKAEEWPCKAIYHLEKGYSELLNFSCPDFPFLSFDMWVGDEGGYTLCKVRAEWGQYQIIQPMETVSEQHLPPPLSLILLRHFSIHLLISPFTHNICSDQLLWQNKPH